MVDDLSWMVLVTNDLEIVPCAIYMQRNVWRSCKRGIEVGGSPDEAAIDSIAAWGMMEDWEDISDTQRSDMKNVILGETQRTIVVYCRR